MRTLGLIDFHCHLDLYQDHEKAIRNAESAGIFTLAVTTTPKAWSRNYELTKNTKYVRAALGLHPQLIETRGAEVALLEELARSTRYIGEVGLDAGPRFYRSFDAQKDVFGRVLQVCADLGGKVLTVHSVRASKAVLDAVEAKFPRSRGKVVLHWFTGTAAEARRAVELGCYFSINAEMLADPRRSSLVQSLPLQNLLTETDGPFTQTEGRPTEPRDVAICVRRLAQLLRSEEYELAERFRSNLRALTGEAIN